MTPVRRLLERRTVPVEVRQAAGNSRRLEGYAATFGVEAQIGDFVETIRAGAFRRSIAGERDILALVDHDPTRVLGRTRSGTLKLAEDSTGLSFAVDLPDTQAARDVLALAERGDLGGMSFGFDVEDDGDEWTGNKRELRCVNLHEISVVQGWPAYSGTVVNARSGRPVRRIGARLADLYLQTMRT